MQMYREAHQVRKRMLGAEHRSTLITANPARPLCDQGRHPHTRTHVRRPDVCSCLLMEHLGQVQSPAGVCVCVCVCVCSLAKGTGKCAPRRHGNHAQHRTHEVLCLVAEGPRH